MSIETQSEHITPVGGNVFADLGFEPTEAAALKAASERIIVAKLAMKDCLTPELGKSSNEAGEAPAASSD